MAIDRTLDLRPGVLDIADNVDNILTLLTPTILNASNVTFSSDFEQYSTASSNKINITVLNGIVYMSGAVKPKVEIASSGEHVILTLPNYCKPKNDKIFIQQGSQSNKFMMRIDTYGKVSMARYGTSSYINCPAGAFLRIDCAYSTY